MNLPDEGTPAGGKRIASAARTDPEQALHELARSDAVNGGDLNRALREICVASAEVLGCERVSLWLYTEDRRAIRCLNLYTTSDGRHARGGRLSASDHPAYFEALHDGRTVAAHDAREDPRTRDFSKSYLDPLGIEAMLDAPILLRGEMIGVVCNEHVGSPRVWTAEEQIFAGSIGDFVSRAMMAAEQREAEAALRESEARYRALVEQLPVVTYITGTDIGKVLFVSPQIETLMGYPVERWRRESPDLWVSRIHPEDRERVMREAARCRRDTDPLSIEYRMFSADGDLRWFRDEAALMRETSGRSLLVQGVMLDITEQKRAEEALRSREEQLLQAQKMEAVGRLAGGVAHDFNNILTAISGHCDLALRKADRDPSLEGQLERIRQTAKRAESLTRQLLAFSRKQVLEPKVIDPNQVLFQLKEMLDSLIGAQVTLSLETDPRAGNVRFDPGQLQQIVMNLAVNARDAMPDGGKLVLRSERLELEDTDRDAGVEIPAGSYVVLTTADTGCGMDEATQAQIFEPFFTTKEAGRGTGLGLPMVYGIVTQSGGHIAVCSAPGAGTAVRIYLPRAREAAEGEAATGSGENDSTRSETVLLVEDDDGVRGVVADYLEQSGYTLLQAESGDAALKVVDSHDGRIDLLLTDVVMPGMNGFELARRLSTSRPGIRVLCMSGYTSEADPATGTDGEVFPLLHKPFDLDDLGKRLREMLDGPSR